MKEKQNKLAKAIWEHLKTRRKYNSLLLKYEVKCEELEDKIDECKTKDRIYKKRQAIWDDTLNEQEKEIINLKKRKVRNVSSSTKKKSNKKD